jgi:hypothetical protein
MRRLILSLIIVVLSFGVSHALSFSVDKTGSGPTGTLYVNQAFTIGFYAHFIEGDSVRLSWSTPFRFYGTGNVTSLTTPGTFVPDAAFDAYFDFGFNPSNNASTLESWDGDLTNSAVGGIDGDQFNYTGIIMNPPWLPNSGTLHMFDVQFDGIVGTSATSGTFCVDSGNFVDNSFDWLLDSLPNKPVFQEVCWDVMIDPNGIGDEERDMLPKDFSLSQNHPNPFNPSTVIDYALPTRANVSISIYNVLGQKIKTLLNEDINAGYHKTTWDGTNDDGIAAASGIYFYKIIAGEFTATKKMILLK